MAWISLCELSELTEGEGKFVEIDGYQLAVFLSEGKAYALDNTCPHAGGPLSAGTVDHGCAVCPWHDWRFELATGLLQEASHISVSAYKTRLLEREGKAALVQADLPVP